LLNFHLLANPYPDSLSSSSRTFADVISFLLLIQIRVLCETPERWTKVYALSQRPPAGQWPKQVEHIPLDFLNNGPEEIAAVMKKRGIKADYIFFFSYILLEKNGRPAPWGDVDFVRVNGLCVFPISVLSFVLLCLILLLSLCVI